MTRFGAMRVTYLGTHLLLYNSPHQIQLLPTSHSVHYQSSHYLELAGVRIGD